MPSIKKFFYLLILVYSFFNVKRIYHYFYNEIPLVSIIIPVHNNFNYTYNCISSILNAENSSYYEIIIIDDLSTDETKFLSLKYFKNYSNIFVYTNKNTNYFVKNCNFAVKKSRGKYIVFLNNDTRVHKKWLYFLIKLIETDSNIGMVGSKLIFPSGVLQEAGGIVWNNGECLNFGRGDNANMPEYNYVKEVDYISGASILVRKSILEKIGGFDERFIPAYYEDTDLAFEFRKRGYKVMYQPKSIIEHYEGLSNGKNLSVGIKQYQKINKNKFIEKWKDKLKYQISEGNTFVARDRGYNKNRIFVIDRFVPNFDKDAGGRFCFMYLNFFIEIGFKVTFLGDDLQKIEPYTTILQQKGIEVLYGDSYKISKLENYLKKNLKFFKFVYFQRPDITIKYINLVKKYFSGKIFYFAHDLHHIRFFREYKITNDIKKLLLSENFKKIEMEIFRKVDIIHVVGNYEYKILKEKFKNKTIHNIPLFIYEKQYNNIQKDFSKRKDLIFVGGFLHSPNVDAILWFTKEIYPKIVRNYPDIILHIVSSYIPNEIKKLESKNIKVEGFLSDENLHLLYQKCRIAIAPLRFGGGVKGKIIEAAHNQIPMVTTSIGAEGFDITLGAFIVEDNPEKMAKIISELYINFSKLKKMSDSGKTFIEKYFLANIAKKIIIQDFND